MSYEIFRHKDFDVAIKHLAKRHQSLADDYEEFLKSLEENPFQGVKLAPNIRKIRMAITSKGRGKAGCARVITVNAIVAEHQGRIALITIYDKADYSSADLKIIRKKARELGFDV